MIRVDGHEYTMDDVRGTVVGLGEIWEHTTVGRDGTAAESVAWEVATEMADLLGEGSIGDDLVGELNRLGVAAAKALDEESAEALMAVTVRGMAAVLEALRASGEVNRTGRGSVVQLNRSDGGVPKIPVPEVVVGLRGLEGDRQASRRHHGRPYQALCLWSAEVIDAFAAEGHPIGYGYAGENVTLSGLDWASVGSGVRMRIGEVLAETSFFALPCSSNAPWFLDGAFNLMHHARGPVSRIYAWVREPGRIAEGDPVEIVR